MAHGVSMTPMSFEEFGRIVAQVMETLPEIFQPYLDNVVVDVQEEPDDEMLRSVGFTPREIAQGASLYGLFSPLELPGPWSGEVVHARDLPHRLIIFKRPLEDGFPNRRRLLIEIRKTVVHELAHHFGYTDKDLEKFDDNPNPFPHE
jgi:predicted Zn-dependent protease with MMP-like domain